MKTKRFIAIMLFVILFCILFSTKVSAYSLFGARFTRGVGNTCYYVDSSASAYTSRINAAANNWVHTGYGYNPIYMTAVSSSHGTHIDLYGNTTSYWGDPNIRGETIMFNSAAQDMTNQISTTNWVYAEIHLNTSVIATNTIETQGTIAHEMGHCFGLAHVNDPNCLMYRYSNGRNTHVVTADENNGINALY